MDVSVVVPVHGNAATVEPLRDRLAAALAPVAREFEVLFVDDACPNGSLEVLRRMASEDPRVGVLALERNVGQNRAVLAGLAASRGARVVVLDADLQDPPEAVPSLLARLEGGVHAAFAARRGRYQSPLRHATGRAYKGVLHILSRRRIPVDAGLFVAMTRTLVDRVVAGVGDESDPHVLVLVARTGLPTTAIPVPRAPRAEGESAYTESMRWRSAWGGVRAALGFGRRGGAPEVRIRERLGAARADAAAEEVRR
jgi:glycosyltransferase involved in cell wall biosynthesis